MKVYFLLLLIFFTTMSFYSIICNFKNNLVIQSYDNRMIMAPDDTVHGCTIKRNKTYEKATILWCTILHKYLEFVWKKIAHYTQNPFKNEVVSKYFNPNIDREICTTILSVFFWFGSNPKCFFSL